MKPRPEIMDIVKSVASTTGLTIQQLLSTTRSSAEIAGARQICWWVASEIYGYSHGEIAQRFDRDRTTVLGGVSSVQKKIAADEDYEGWVDIITGAVAQRASGKGASSQKTDDEAIDPSVERITTLRSRGMSVDSIVKCTGYDETFVARVCGVSLWKGKSTYSIGKDIQS